MTTLWHANLYIYNRKKIYKFLATFDLEESISGTYVLTNVQMCEIISQA